MTALPSKLCAQLLIAALLFLAGCGKKGPLVPPEALVPAPIANLAVAQKGDRFQVSWSAPGKQEGGGTLKDLAGFVLFRRPLLPPDEDCEQCATAYGVVTRIDLDFLKTVRRVGSLFLYDDSDLTPGKSYQYKVHSLTEEGAESRDSNKAHHRVLVPPLPPVVEALSSASGVVLAFVAPATGEGILQGFNVYRSRKGGEMPLTPLNPKPITGRTYEDKAILIGVAYAYRVTAVAALNAETVESAPSVLVAGVMQERD